MASRIGRRESQQLFFSAGVVLKKGAKILKSVFFSFQEKHKMELWKIVFLSLILPPMSYQKQRGNTFTTVESK